MPALDLKDFHGGLDSRKNKLSAPEGTLTALTNGHITPGGDIEKRRAYVKQENPSGSGTSLPAGLTFGMQEVASGILVFGSASLTGYLPVPFSYQQLQHPAVYPIAYVAYDADLHAMTDVVHSCTFGGKAFVAATFADGYTFCYYDGQIVNDFIAGEILPHLAYNNSNVAESLATLVNETVSYTAQQNNSTDNVFGPAGSSYSVADTLSTVAGGLTSTLVDNGTAAVSGLPATGQFTLQAGSNSVAATAKIDSNGTNPTSGATVTIAGQAYRILTAPSAAYDVQLGASSDLTLKNLIMAVNGTGVAGTNYFAGTYANPNAVAGAMTGTGATAATILTASAVGSGGNSLGLSQTGTTGYTLTGFANGVSNTISAATVGATYARNFLTSNGTNVSNGDTVTVGGKVYTFVTALTPTEGQVLIGSTQLNSLQNLIYAINHTGVPTVNYSCALPNAQVRAVSTIVSQVVTVVAVTSGSSQNSVVTTTTSTVLAWTTTTLTGGTDSTAILPNPVDWNGSPSNTASLVAAAINAGTASTGYSANASAATVFVSSPTNSFSNGAPLSTTATGNVCVGACQFQFAMLATGTANISSVQVNGISITSGTVNWSTNLQTLVAALVANINAYTGTSGYVAYSSGLVMFVSAATTSSSDAPVSVQVNFSASNIIGVSQVGSSPLSVHLSLTSAFCAKPPSLGTLGSFGDLPSAVVTCLATGGVGPYTYFWSRQAGSDPGFVVGSSASLIGGSGSNLQSVVFRYVGSGQSNRKGTAVTSSSWTCTVTDSLGNTGVSSILNVSAA